MFTRESESALGL